ncbi:MAG: peptide ABC transporter substrate-binding protein [Phycisphaeraceae bacterium]
MLRCLTAALVLCVPLALVGCEEPVPDADLVYISNAEHAGLDPQAAIWVHDIRVLEHLYEPLLDYDFDKGELVPAVAERWEVSDDGLTYTFHLRDDARWSTGEPVVARDFIFAWRRAMLPEMASNYSTLMYRIRGAEAFLRWRQDQLRQYLATRDRAGGGDAAEQLWETAEARFNDTVGLSAPDDRTLVVELERPAPYFPLLTTFVTFMPVHRASIAEAQQLDPASGAMRMPSGHWTDANRLVTNGPYKLSDHQPRRYLLMTASETYWNGAALANGSILERIIPDAQNAALTYRRGRADIWPNMPSGDLAAGLVADASRDDVHTATIAGTYFYNFNCGPTLPGGGDNPLADPRVRRALSMAIDREQIVQRITRLNQPVARTYIPPDVIPGYDPPAEHGVGFDPEAARQLLADAGHPDGQGIDGLSILYNSEGEHGPVAEAVRAMWREHLNVHVSLEEVSLPHFNDRKNNHDYTICRASWIGSYPEPTYWLDRKRIQDAGNETGWSNARYDALLDEAADEPDNARRLALLREAEALLLDEQPMAMIFQYVGINLWDPARVTGPTPNAWMRWRFDNVRVER